MTHRVPKDCNVGKYGAAEISRLLEIICLFCKRTLYKTQYSVKETYNVKEPHDRGHPTARRVEKCRANTSGLCNTLQHTATHCNTLQHIASHRLQYTLQHIATRCNTLQHTLTQIAYQKIAMTESSEASRKTSRQRLETLQHIATQHTATHCNTHIAIHCHTLQHKAYQKIAVTEGSNQSRKTSRQRLETQTTLVYYL